MSREINVTLCRDLSKSVVNEFHFVQNLLINPYDISFHPP